MSVSALLQRAKVQFSSLDHIELLRALGTPAVVLAVLGMVVLPMAAWLLDILFAFNISLAIVVLLVAVYTKRPLDFAIFPSVLLITTLLRLSLNVASTRLVLLEGHEGGDAAGKVIEAFGSVVIGGNYAVGFVVFMILMIINFVVVTKGAGRISEVSARFTLDAMPGKQMAIDADLNAGIIDQEEARSRRSDVTKEADFYGSMDGASKFVKGDAIAGLLILFINIIGGFFIGIVQHDLELSEALKVYTLLTIGDGLVAQIPSLLLSVAAALIVTRQNTTEDMGEQLRLQLFNNPRVLIICGSLLMVMGLVPGMPHFAFLSAAAICFTSAWLRYRRETKAALKAKTAPAKVTSSSSESKELDWEDLQALDVIGLEVGYRLIPLVDQSQGGELLSRIKGVRKKLSQDSGFLIPSVHIRDNLDLGPNYYRVLLQGVIVGEAEVFHDQEMAINPGQVFGPLNGTQTHDPAFGLEAYWIDKAQREQAQALGYTVVDSSTVVATHLSQLLNQNISQLLGFEEVQKLLDILGQDYPKLVEGLIPDAVNLSNFVKVLQNLLQEGVMIKDLRSIVQTLLEYGPKSQDPDVLTAACRISLRRFIAQDLIGHSQELPVITLSAELEQILHQSMQVTGNESAGMEPGLAEKLQQSLSEACQTQELAGQSAILLTSGILRASLARFVKVSIPNLRVISYQEVPDDKQIKIVHAIGQS